MMPVRTSLLSAGSLAAVLGSLSMPVEAALVTFVETSNRANLVGSNLAVGDNTVTSVGYTYLDSVSYAATMSVTNISPLNVAASTTESTSWLSLNGVSSPVAAGKSDGFNVRINPTGESRGAKSGSFTYNVSDVAAGGTTTEAHVINVNTTFVAPVASSTVSTVYVLAGSGNTGNTAVTLKNVGDGNLSGLGGGTNLSGATNVRTLTTGWTGSVANTSSLADGASSSAGTLTYKAQASRATNTMTVTSAFTNGNPNNLNTANTLTTTLTGVTVAPVQSVANSGTTIYALPGMSVTRDVTIQNIGDGSFVSKTLDGTVTTNNGTGFSSTAAGAFSLNDGKTGPAASTLTQTVTYAGVTRGASSTASVIAAFTNGSSAGTNAAQTVTTTFNAQTVAPVASVAATASAGTVRVGTSASASFVVKNTGDGNKAGADNGTTLLSNLRGTVGASAGVFSGGGNAINLIDAGSTSASFVFAPTARGAQSTTVTTTLQNGADTSNNKGTANTVVSGTAVGPVYGATISGGGAIVNGGRIDFGEFVGGLTMRDLLISNLSNDAASKSLTDLTLTSISISDANEFSFSLSGFNTINSPTSGVVSNLQNSTKIGDIQIQFNNLTSKSGQAYLTIQTDEGAALGASGAVYVYDLRWTVPEPGTIMVLGTGLLGLAISRRNRRRQNNEAVSLTRKDDGAA